MLNNVIVACSEIALSTTSSFDFAIWIPAIISIISLIVNTIFTIFIAPIILTRQNQKTEMYKICSGFFGYLTRVVSLKSYEGAPSQIRRYSLKIHLMFKSGNAPEPISTLLEEIFQLVEKRKSLTEDIQIRVWETIYRTKVHELRKGLSKYVGVFR